MSADTTAIAELVPETHADLLQAPVTAVLTTVGADGLPQSTAVWFLVEEGTLKTSLITSRQKYKNLTRNPKATLFILDPANPYRTLEVRAEIELLADPDKRMLPKFAAHYGADEATLDIPGSDRVIAVFQPRRVVSFP